VATIIVVDDSRIVLDYVQDVLQGAGHNVVTVESPFGISGAVQRHHPDLVLVDVNMPALSGDALISIARRHAGEGNTRFVLHSDIALADLAAKASWCGANGFIRKTNDRQAFLRQVETFLCGKASE